MTWKPSFLKPKIRPQPVHFKSLPPKHGKPPAPGNTQVCITEAMKTSKDNSVYIFPGDQKYHLAFHEPMLGLYRHSHTLKYTSSLLMFGHNAGTETKMYEIITRSWISYPAMYIFNWTSNKQHVGLAERQNVGKQSRDDSITIQPLHSHNT